MERARSTLAVPGDPTLPTALAAHSDPPISVARSSETVVEFGSAIGDIMLRSRVVQALEAKERFGASAQPWVEDFDA